MRAPSIRYRITAITVAAILVSILSIVAASHRSIQEETDRSSVEMMGMIGKDTKNTLDEYFVGIEQSARVAANMAVDSLDSVVLAECGAVGSQAGNRDRTPEQSARLDAYMAGHCDQTLKAFESVASHTNGVVAYYYCLSPDISDTEHGFSYARVGKAGFVSRTPIEAAALDPEDEARNTWYFTPVRHGRPCWVGPYQARDARGAWICSYVVPVYCAGALIGVLGMDIGLDTLVDQVRPIQVYETGYACLLDEEGHTLYHPVLKQWTVPELQDLSVSMDFLRKEDSGDQLIRYTIGGEERQLSYFTLRNGMKLAVSAPVEEITASWTRLIHIITIISVVVIAIFAVIILLAIRSITFPLVQLTEASQQLADGDYSVALNYRRNDEIGKLTQAFIRMRDEIKSYIGDLNRRINTDMLTGLPNMRYFFKLALEERDRLLGEGKAPVMLYFDLVGMKHFNRQFGLEEGDALLRQVGQILRQRFGERCVCRYSEDHFAAVSEEATVEQELREVFRELEKANGGNSLPVRVGIFAHSTEEVGVNVACDRAKFACDKHSDTYVSGYYYFDRDMQMQLDGVRYITSHLDRALAEGWIQVYYQPIIRAVNGHVCDEEALARWIDPERGMLSPGVFIPILETARLIYKLDLYVLDRVLEKMRAQKKEGLQVVPHSLNLSRADFDACDIVEEICRRVDEAGIARDRLTIEITESIIGDDFEFMKEQVHRFRALGFQVWMDDFGSGYSSLNVLQDIHFDLLKFDMQFLKRFSQGEESKIILTDLIRMAVDLGVDTVCEGVETADEVEFLRQVGCRKLQGYYYGKPIPYEEILERYRRGIQIGFENTEETAYYAAIGGVNLYDLRLIAEKEGGGRNYYNTMPAGVIELAGDKVNYVRTNPAFRRFIKRNYGMDLGVRSEGYSAHPQGSPAMFLKLVMQCSLEDRATVYDGKLPDGSTVHGVLTPLCVNPVTGARAVAIAVLSVTEPDKNETYIEIASALATDYCNIFVIDLDTDAYTEYASQVGGDELAVLRRGSDFFASARQESMTRVYEEDRESFLSWFTKEHILHELEVQGVFTTIYRLMDTGTPVYANMKITRMPGGNRIIVGISIVDSQMKQKKHEEELQKERDMMARVMALSDGYLTLYTVDLETEHYLEYSSTDEYNTLGMAKEGTDFFHQSAVNAARYFYPEDVAAFRESFTRENVLREIREQGCYRTHYRLMIGGVPRPVLLKAALFTESGEEKLTVGVRAWQKRRSPAGAPAFDDEDF